MRCQRIKGLAVARLRGLAVTPDCNAGRSAPPMDARERTADNLLEQANDEEELQQWEKFEVRVCSVFQRTDRCHVRIVRDGQGLHSRVTRRVLTPCMPCGPQMPGATMADLAVYSRPMPWPSYRTHIAATVRRRLGCSVCHKLLTEITVYIVGGITHGLVATADVGEVHCRPQNEAKIDFRRFRYRTNGPPTRLQ